MEGETSSSLLQEVLSLVLEATEDKIPNVRFTAAQVKREGGREGGREGEMEEERVSRSPVDIDALYQQQEVTNTHLLSLPPSLFPPLPPFLQVLAKLSSFVDPSSLESSIQPCLQNLVSSDPDGDVRFYSALALEQKEEVTLAVAAPAAVDSSDAGAAASALAAAVAATGGVGVGGMG